MIERKIIIGVISSTEFAKEILPHYKPEFLESNTAREIMSWVKEYFEKYSRAPGKDIKTIFFSKVKEGLLDSIAEEFEDDILPSLSDEFVEEGLDDYLFDETIKHFREVQYKFHIEELTDTMESDNIPREGKLEKVKSLMADFTPLQVEKDKSLALHSEEVENALYEAFSDKQEPVIVFPKELGEFWNAEFVPGGFIGILAPEKRGKSWLLLEIGMRAARQGKNVIMYQAGDMNQAAQLRRIAVYLNRRNYSEKYCGSHFQPVKDCLKNQANTCYREEREDSTGIGHSIEEIRGLKMTNFVELVKEYPDHAPCYNCEEWKIQKLGVPWFKEIPAHSPIDAKAAISAVRRFFQKYKGRFYLSTYANGTLSVTDIENDISKKYEDTGFRPDLILIDYGDLLVPSQRGEFRHQQNEIWKGLRRLSQTPIGGVLPLVVSPTQADGASYQQTSLSLKNYSEDKRKYAHVTAFYGLNQDPKGREKGLGLLRIGELMLREGDFNISNQITLLQDLRIGRPYISAFWGGENKTNKKKEEKSSEE